jgi:hypothetical protein
MTLRRAFISIEMANEIRKHLDLPLANPPKLDLTCEHCGQLLDAHYSGQKKQGAHFEHRRENPLNCSPKRLAKNTTSTPQVGVRS